MFDELFKRFDNFDERWVKWEKRFTDEKSARKEKDNATEERISSLELYCTTQYNAAVIADN
jgi:hypothetical protein